LAHTLRICPECDIRGCGNSKEMRVYPSKRKKYFLRGVLFHFQLLL
jgi:hypothetical protein